MLDNFMYYDCVDIIQKCYLVFQGGKKFKEILYWTVFTPSEREGRCLLQCLNNILPCCLCLWELNTYLSKIFVFRKKKKIFIHYTIHWIIVQKLKNKKLKIKVHLNSDHAQYTVISHCNPSFTERKDDL